MSLMVFIGGIRSGKSQAAEATARKLYARGEEVVVAVFGDESVDGEFKARIEKHKQNRPEGFSTLEAFLNPLAITEVPDDQVLVIDCLSTALGAAQVNNVDFDAFLSALIERSYHGKTIVVTSETGLSLVSDSKMGRDFQDALGRANQILVHHAQAAYLVVAGRLIDLKTCPTEVEWIED